MKRPALHLLIASILFGMVAVSCSDGGEQSLRRAVALYQKGPSSSAIVGIGNAVLAMSEAGSFKRPFPAESGDALILRDKSSISIVFPFNRTIDGGEDTVILMASLPDRTVAAAHEDGLVLYTGRNGKRTVHSPKNPARAAGRLDGDAILFLTGNGLFRYSHSKDLATPFLAGEKFPPPFQGGFYRASLVPHRELVLIITGIAGRYNMSLVSTTVPSVIFKNRQVASPRLAFWESCIIYVTGAPGAWTVAETSLDGRSTRTLLRLSRLSDIALFPGGVLYKEDETLQALPRGTNTPRSLPFGWRLAGQAGPAALVEHDGSLYALDAAKLFTALRLIEHQSPEVLKH
ncbi:MAG TPA: hypothetical protein VLM75_03530 [Spirochaetota bacterium]|nr:hypothetical protein [Spirochaetota bacterium]